jgi:radical SAM superfamily enzyme YgiQ (UPF0313 family)
VADIVLTALNAKYIHAAFGLRYLLANLGELRPSAALVEFDINQRPLDIAETILAREPKIIGFGVYIWNVAPTTEVVAAIKRLRPGIKIILGGPEVSYETEGQPIVQLADHVITGEADLKFAEVCRGLLNHFHTLPRPARNERGEGRGEGLLIEMASSPQPSPPLSEEREKTSVPLPKIIPAEVPDFSKIILPYDLYTDDDLAHRIIYVEASRGCPFTCEFCLSSLDIPVRQVPLPAFLDQMQQLLDRGVKQFKFVDRTFNLNVATSRAILEFFLTRHQPGHFYHFEMIPDRLPAELREIIARFPPGTLQFEVGIQTFNPEVGALISRRQNCERLADNFNFLRRETGVHIHADLIVGLPGETVESFGAGFDRLIALDPQEIQVGILKRLRGTPIVRHDAQWQMVYSAHPPYEILQNRLVDFATMQRLRRFAKYWDIVGNSGNFLESTPLIWKVEQASNPSEINQKAGRMPVPPSPFQLFFRFSDWLYARVKRTDSIALLRLMELLFEFLTDELQLDPKFVAETLWQDYKRGGRHDKPGFMKDFLSSEEPLLPPSKTKIHFPKRQARHLV